MNNKEIKSEVKVDGDLITTTKKDLNMAVSKKIEETSDRIVETSLKQIEEVGNNLIEKFKELNTVEKKNVPIIAVKDVDVPNKIGRFALARAKAGNNNELFRKYLSDLSVDKYMTTTDTEGGEFVPEIIADEVIQYLNNNAVIRKAGAGILDMPSGNVKFPKFTAGVTGYWKGEATPTTAATPTTGSVSLTSKILAVDIPISNQLLRYGGSNTAREIEALLLQGIVATEDDGFINGSGTSSEPLGLSSQINSGNSVTATSISTATGTIIKSELQALIKKLLTNNIPMLRPAWVMHPRDYIALQNQTDGNGNEMRYSVTLQTSNQLFGYPVFITNNVEINTDQTEIYLIDFAFVKIGQGKALDIRFSENGSYYNGSAYVSGESTDESVFKASNEVDIAMTIDLAGAKLTGVDWGA